MKQSSSPNASSLVKTAALFMAVPALLLPMKAAAQQMAANTPDFSRCDQISRTDPKSAISCRVEVLHAQGAAARQQTAVAERRIAAAEDSIVCAKFLLAKKSEGVALDPTRLNRDKGCIYARELGMQ